MPFSRNYGDYSPATTETIFGGFNWSHQFNDDWSVKHRFSVNQRSLSGPSYIASQATQAIATFGFLELKLTRLEIVVAEENLASRRVAEKVGARFECIARNRLVIRGVPHDSAVYSL